MQAIMVSEPGGPEVLRAEETEIPRPGPGEVLVRVLAAGVGPWDVSLRRSETGQFPYIPGGEFAGTVAGDTGSDAFLDDGAPVYGYPGLTGCYAEYVCCQAEQLAPIPSSLTAIEAAAVPIDGLTALQGLTDVLGVTSGDTVVITAAAGGLGHLATQIARILGASVVATASEQHHAYVHKLGAEAVVDHRKPDWPEQVRSLIGGGATKVLACAAPTLAGAAQVAADGGEVATPVHADSYPDGERIQWRRYDGRPTGTGLIRMAPWFDDGSLSVELAHRMYWKDVAAAHEEIERGHTLGKIVLIVDDDLAASAGA